jgi:hypothetical protein
MRIYGTLEIDNKTLLKQISKEFVEYFVANDEIMRKILFSKEFIEELADNVSAELEKRGIIWSQ